MNTATAEIANEVTAEVTAASTVTLGRAAELLAGKTDKTADDILLEQLVAAELGRRRAPRVHVDNSAHGTVLVGADSDGHGGYVRGIVTFAGVYMAIDATFSKHFKTLTGAARFMERRGFDTHGRRI